MPKDYGVTSSLSLVIGLEKRVPFLGAEIAINSKIHIHLKISMV